MTSRTAHRRGGSRTSVKSAAAARVKPTSAHGQYAGRAQSELARAVYMELSKVVQRLPGSKLKPIRNALQSNKPLTAIALIATELKPVANDDSVIGEALVRGARLKEELVEKAGGLLTSKRAAAAIGISPQALHKRLTKGSLLAVGITGGDLGYPAFQFETEAMQAGVAAVLKAIRIDDPWARFSFFFLTLDELGEETPVHAIKSGNTEAAVLAAGHYGEHGAS